MSMDTGHCKKHARRAIITTGELSYVNSSLGFKQEDSETIQSMSR